MHPTTHGRAYLESITIARAEAVAKPSNIVLWRKIVKVSRDWISASFENVRKNRSWTAKTAARRL